VVSRQQFMKYPGKSRVCAAHVGAQSIPIDATLIVECGMRIWDCTRPSKAEETLEAQAGFFSYSNNQFESDILQSETGNPPEGWESEEQIQNLRSWSGRSHARPEFI